ncbi:MAG: hypothetical protein AB7G47_21280 [Mycolicibacterium sp.]|uniref:hypothetical protein n=1 Tax=Mycolicibacterium sp. TaxID=2320850 RepID=UPI003D118E5D
MAKGYQTAGDVLVNQTADGIDLNTVFAEIQSALSIWNSERSTIAGLLSFKTTTMGDSIPQGTTDSFEVASEFGVPHATSAPTALPLGYTFEDYDLRQAWTWKFARDATAAQLKALANTALDADNRLTTVSVLRRLFDPTQETNEVGVPCYGLWNNDGMVPPPALGKTFPGTTTHYLPTGSATLDSGDIEGLAKLVTDKNYGTTPGSKLLILANPTQGDLIQSWRAGEENANSQKSRWSFIPSAAAPPYLTQETLVGERAPEKWNGVEVAGSLGPMWLIQSNFIPAGYVAVVASSGMNAAGNVIGFREHANAAYRGLRLIPGNGPYPLVSSYLARGFGVGVRRRGAAAVAQCTTEGTYTAPVLSL